MSNRFRRTRFGAGALLVTTFVAASGGMAMGQTRVATGSPPPFPGNPASWINSSPLSTEMLAGKGVILYFFHDG